MSDVLPISKMTNLESMPTQIYRLEKENEQLRSEIARMRKVMIGAASLVRSGDQSYPARLLEEAAREMSREEMMAEVTKP